MSVGLVESIRRAVKDDRVTSVANTIARLHEYGILEDRALYPSALSEHYARRLVWRDPGGRFVLVAMTWAPGQMTRLHDHDGLWGVEIVVDGTMQETAYRLVDRDRNDRYRFVREDVRTASKGTAGAVCPPYDYHTFGNIGNTPAHTLHVYGGVMAQCNVFTPEADGWWAAQSVQLHYDA
jgi:predicted metal-dependent enzyme (double-stranded beta helix superfamily)